MQLIRDIDTSVHTYTFYVFVIDYKHKNSCAGSVSLYETYGRAALAIEVGFSEADIARWTFVCCSVDLHLRTECMLVRSEVASFH